MAKVKKATKKTEKKTEKKAEEKLPVDSTDLPEGSHPKHPKCETCGRAMYKTMVPGRSVRPLDPWAYCRNPECDLYGEKQSSDETADERVAKAAAGETAPKGEAESKPKTKLKAVKGKGKVLKAKKTELKGEVKKVKKTKKAKPEGAPRIKKAAKALVPKGELEPKKATTRIKEIRKALKTGKFTQAEIIHKFKTSRKTVSKLVKEMISEGEL